MSSMLSTAASYTCSAYHCHHCPAGASCLSVPHDHMSAPGQYVHVDEALLQQSEQHLPSHHHHDLSLQAAGGVPSPLVLSSSSHSSTEQHSDAVSAYSPVYALSPESAMSPVESQTQMYYTTQYDCLASPEGETLYYAAGNPYDGTHTPTTASSPMSSPQRSPFSSSGEYSPSALSMSHCSTPQLSSVAGECSTLNMSPSSYASPAPAQYSPVAIPSPSTLGPAPPGYTWHYPVYQPYLVPVGQAPPAGYAPYPQVQMPGMQLVTGCVEPSTLLTSSPMLDSAYSAASTARAAAQARRDRRSARQRDPGYVPRPANPFICFRQNWLKELQQGIVEYDGPRDQRTMSFRISQDWNKLSEEGKGKFRKEALNRKKLHALKYPGYKFAPKQKDFREMSSSPLED